MTEEKRQEVERLERESLAFYILSGKKTNFQRRKEAMKYKVGDRVIVTEKGYPPNRPGVIMGAFTLSPITGPMVEVIGQSQPSYNIQFDGDDRIYGGYFESAMQPETLSPEKAKA